MMYISIILAFIAGAEGIIIAIIWNLYKHIDKLNTKLANKLADKILKNAELKTQNRNLLKTIKNQTEHKKTYIVSEAWNGVDGDFGSDVHLTYNKQEAIDYISSTISSEVEYFNTEGDIDIPTIEQCKTSDNSWELEICGHRFRWHIITYN